MGWEGPPQLREELPASYIYALLFIIKNITIYHPTVNRQCTAVAAGEGPPSSNRDNRAARAAKSPCRKVFSLTQKSNYVQYKRKFLDALASLETAQVSQCTHSLQYYLK